MCFLMFLSYLLIFWCLITTGEFEVLLEIFTPLDGIKPFLDSLGHVLKTCTNFSGLQ